MKTFSLCVVTLVTLAACELAGQTCNYTTIAGAAWVVGCTDGTNGMAHFQRSAVDELSRPFLPPPLAVRG